MNSSPKESPPSKPRRRGYQKSSRGCQTCRIRHVKCDETLPQCRACTSTGRSCEGPSSQRYRFAHDANLAKLLVTQTKATDLHGDNLLSTLPVDSAERQAFNTYLVVAAPLLSGTFDANLWYRLVPQLSHSEPAVWNACLAISHFFVRGRQPQDALQRHVLQATTWYSRSIQSLKAVLNQHPDRPAIALLTCVLFVSDPSKSSSRLGRLRLLLISTNINRQTQVCVEESLNNVASGMSLMDQALKLLVDGVGTNGQHVPLKSSAVWNVMLPFLTRHAILAETLGQPLPLDLRERIARHIGSNWWQIAGSMRHVTALIYGMRDMEEARLSLYTLMYYSYTVVRLVNLDQAMGIQPGRDLLLSRLLEWSTVVADIEKPADPDQLDVFNYELSMLSMYYHVAFVWLASCLDGCQTAFDQYRSSFEDIIHCAEHCIGSPFQHSSGSSSTTFSMSTTPPLYFAVMKCRHRDLRRRALAVLEQSPKGSHLWNALPTVRIAEKAIEIEEEGMDPYRKPRVLGVDEQLPPEQSRIHNFQFIQHAAVASRPSLAMKVLRFRHDALGFWRPYEDVYYL